MHRVVRPLALLSLCALAVMTMGALPDRAECMAPDVRFQQTWIVALHVAFTIAAVAASFAFSRAHPWLACAFLVTAHVSASRALERVVLSYPTDDRAYAVHAHGPWALLRTHEGDGRALLESFRFAR